MNIRSIELKNFRNYEDLKISFDAGTNILSGDNAQGKTNILEAVYLCGTTKSHRGSRDKEMIRFGADEAHIRVVLVRSGKEYQIDMHLKNGRSKGIAVNRLPIRKAGELFGILNIVFFSPEDLNIIKSGPAERRRFLDTELCQLDRIYLSDLTNYNKILNQRNKLLKDIVYRPDLQDTLQVWDMQLIDTGRRIIRRRKQFVDELRELVRDIHYRISGEKEELLIRYEPNVKESLFEEELNRIRLRDLKLCQTSVGPHRDDLLFSIRDADLRKFGSQGLLLDDVLSELDSNRQNYLLNNICNIQTVITCTGLDEFVRNRFQINKVFEVINGQIFEKGLLDSVQ